MSYVPPTYTLYGSSNDGNTVTFMKEGSTVQKPLLFVITRRVSSYNQGTGTFSVPQMDFKVSRGQANVDGVPQPEKEIGTLTLRNPVTAGEGELEAVVADIIAIMSSESFVAAVKSQQIPLCCDVEE